MWKSPQATFEELSTFIKVHPACDVPTLPRKIKNRNEQTSNNVLPLVICVLCATIKYASI
jgi:hypothetical protein